MGRSSKCERGLLPLALLAATSVASAQSRGDAAPAQVLFDDATALMKARRYTEACDKFLASHLIDPKCARCLPSTMKERSASAPRERE